jgi:O-methyltransferase
VLWRLRGSSLGEDWDEERAIADLATVVRHGSKHEPALYAYLGYLAQVWAHARFVEHHFPYINPTYRSGDKDAVAVQTGSDELLAIAAHLATVQAHGVSGSLLEFGCFKGHSTCVLSFACALLGVQMEVFDSFEGLPESDSGAYRPGEFAGGLEEVKQNVAGLGRPEQVRFHKGFFSDSLARWEPDRVALVWMDVDLESSSRDVMRIFEHVPKESAIFSHECWPTHFVDGAVVPAGTPEAVLRPIVDSYAAAGRTPTGRFIAGNTGAIWDRDTGVPVLSVEGLRALRDMALEG